MKKTILFVMNKLICGGAEKSLISLLETIDYTKYEVDLLLFKREGLFLDKVPKQVKLLEVPSGYKYFDMPIRKAIIDSTKNKRIDIALSRILAGYIFRSEKNKARCEQRAWKYVSKSMGKISKEYDAAIGYLEKAPIYYVIEKVNAKKKIGWVHTNYSNSGMDKNIDNIYFEKLDNIVTVSQECAKALEENFIDLVGKVKVIQNIISPRIIMKMSKDKLHDSLMNDKAYTKIVTVARLGFEKGIDIAIDCCKLLVDSGYKVKWFVLGDGTEIEKIKTLKLIKKNGLEGFFYLLGVKDNPYPYINESDIYVQPSRFEGKSIAIEEAKVLGKPIVVTNFSTAKDQIENNKNGLIVEMDSNSLAQGIKKLINSEELKNKLVLNLSEDQIGTEDEIAKLYKLVM